MTFLKERNNVLSWKIPQMQLKIETSNNIRQIVGDSPFMIMDQPYDFYFFESPLLFGWFFQGENKQLYKDELLKLYPDVYIYDGGQKKFFLWGNLFTESEIIEKYQQIYLFINSSKAEAYAPILSNIQALAKTECVYENPITNNKLYKIEVNQSQNR